MRNEFVAIEEGMITGPKMARLVVRGGEGVADAGRATTSSVAPTVSDKALKNSGDNAILVSISMLGDPANRAATSVIVHSGKPVEQWHSRQNKALRSSPSASAWLQEEIAGGFMTHVMVTFRQIEKPSVLELCSVEMPLPGDTVEWRRDCHFEVMQQDALASLFGRLTSCLASKRMQRCLWAFRGWPIRFAGLMGSQELKEFTVAEFKKDLEAFQDFKDSVPDGTRACKKLVDRTLFHHVSVRQFIEVVLRMLQCVSWQSQKGSLQPWCFRIKALRRPSTFVLLRLAVVCFASETLFIKHRGFVVLFINGFELCSRVCLDLVTTFKSMCKFGYGFEELSSRFVALVGNVNQSDFP